MRIDDSQLIQRLQNAYKPKIDRMTDSDRARRTKEGHYDSVTEPDSAGSDKVSLSPLSQQIQKIRKAIEADPGIREEKIAELRRLIASGQYSVSDEDLARKIVEHFLGDGA